MINKYIKIYNTRNCLLALFCAGFVFIPWFVVSFIYDAMPQDTLFSFVPFLIAALCITIASLYTIRFKKMIQSQEQLYNVKFNDDDVVHLETTLYLSRDWLIWAGSSAIYKRHIKSIYLSPRHGRGSSFSNEVGINTVDGKEYRIWCMNSLNIEKIIAWKKK